MNVLPAASGDVSLIDGAVSLIDGTAAGLIADVMFALSAPSRVQILGSLLGGPLAVGDITELLGMEQSAVSHQLRVLREAGLVGAERRGKQRVYTIAGDTVRELLAAARHLAGLWEPGDDSQRDKAAGTMGS